MLQIMVPSMITSSVQQNRIIFSISPLNFSRVQSDSFDFWLIHRHIRFIEQKIIEYRSGTCQADGPKADSTPSYGETRAKSLNTRIKFNKNCIDRHNVSKIMQQRNSILQCKRSVHPLFELFVSLYIVHFLLDGRSLFS